jgi:pimeloyl-ACP methyl ester carboxylesterase
MTTAHEQQPTSIGPRTAGQFGGSFRERRPVVTLFVALLIGAVATAAGAGIGIRYLQKTGLSLGTVVGLTLLAAGLVALGYATRVAWTLLHGWWRLVLLPAGVALLPVLFSTALAVMVTVVPPTTLGSGTPADEGLDYRDVTFETADGVSLSGWFVPSRNGAALVVRHGAGSTRTATLDQAGVLGRDGYGLLLVDARGHGLSEGRGMDLGWYGDQDIEAAVDFLAAQPGVDPERIGLLGLSMGGEEAVGAAAADPRIRAVVAEGVTARTAADKDQWLPGGAAGTVQRALDAYTFGVTDLLTPAAPPTPLHEAVATSDADFLLVTAGRVPDEVRAAEAFADAAPARVQVLEIPEATHTDGLDTAPEVWTREVLGFLDDHLRPPA